MLKGFDVYKHLDRIRLKKLAYFVNFCSPIQAKALHFFCGRNKSLLTYVLPAFKYLLGKDLRIRMVVHGGTGVDYLADIKRYGLCLQKISYVLGGGFSYQNYLDWLEAQRCKEQERHTEPPCCGDIHT